MDDSHIRLADRQEAKAPWLRALRVYLLVAAGGHLLWESAQAPLYAIWTEGDIQEKLFAILHCTAGDVLIAMASLAAGLVLAGDPLWPRRRFLTPAAITLFIGLGYTIYSEWRNIELENWTYAPSMPTIPRLGTGLAPLLQWLIIPTLSHYAARRQDARGA